MLFDSTFQKYLVQRPVAVMTRATLEHAFAAEALDDLFERTAQRQYTQQLSFSTVVALVEAVVFRRQPSVNSAYKHSPTDIPASLSSVYDKLNHTEPGLSEALVRHTALRLLAVAECWPPEADAVAGLRLKQLDGNYLAGTDRRLGELRGHGAAALPGLALVVRDDRTGLLTDLVACEDAYAQERSLVGRVARRPRRVVGRRPELRGRCPVRGDWVARVVLRDPVPPGHDAPRADVVGSGRGRGNG